MGLDEQLQAERQRRTADEAVRLAYEDVFTTLSHNGFLSGVLPEDAAFPDFVLPNVEGRLVSLASRLAEGPVVVQFFRGEWCPFCRLMLDALVTALPEIEAAGASLLALTPDMGPWARQAKQNHGATFEVLSDVDCGVGLAAGVVFRIPAIYRSRLMRAGIDFADRHGNGSQFLPIPAVFLLDGGGRVAWRFVNVDFTRRAAPDRILGALRCLARPERE